MLVGRWVVQVKVEGVGSARCEFSWIEDGAYLRQYTDIDEIAEGTPSEWRQNAPFPTIGLIGLDDSADEYTMLYADARNVFRVYRMTVADGLWTMVRRAPGFNQRFFGALSEDGDRIDARWEMSEGGEHWHTDFELTYTRAA